MQIDKKRLKDLLMYMIHEDNGAIGLIRSHIRLQRNYPEQTTIEETLGKIEHALGRISDMDDYIWDQLMELITNDDEDNS